MREYYPEPLDVFQPPMSEAEKKRFIYGLEDYLVLDLAMCLQDKDTGINRAILAFNHDRESEAVYNLSIDAQASYEERAYLFLRAAGDVMLGTLQEHPVIVYPKPEEDHIRAYKTEQLEALSDSASFALNLLYQDRMDDWSHEIRARLARMPQGWEQALKGKMALLQKRFADPKVQDRIVPVIEDHILIDLNLLLDIFEERNDFGAI